MAEREQQTTEQTADDFVAGMILVALLLAAVLVPVDGLIFGWGDALELLGSIGVLAGIAILVRLLGRGLPRMVRQVVLLAVVALAAGLVFDWVVAVSAVIGVGVVLMWQLWSEHDRAPG